VVGLDVADGAVGYGVATGALDAAITENLEDTAPSAALAAQMRTVDLITTFGGVGYVSERTFTALVDASDPTAWSLNSPVPASRSGASPMPASSGGPSSRSARTATNRRDWRPPGANHRGLRRFRPLADPLPVTPSAFPAARRLAVVRRAAYEMADRCLVRSCSDEFASAFPSGTVSGVHHGDTEYKQLMIREERP